jgi:hypothetical protein
MPAVQAAGLWNGIIAAAAPRMAAGQPPRGENNAAPGPVSLDCFRGVFRAGRQEAAGRWQQGRYEQLIAAHHGAQHHPHHPRTLMPFHLMTPARRPTNTPQRCRAARAAECARLRSAFTNTSVEGEASPYGIGLRRRSGALLCGHDNERKSERTSGLTTPLGEEIKTGWARQSIVFAFLRRKDPTHQILISSEPKVALAGGVVPLLSTLGRASRGTVLTRA